MDQNDQIDNDEIIDTSLNKDEFLVLQKRYKKELKEITLEPGDKAEKEIWLTFSYLGPKLISKNNISIPLSSGGSREIDVLVVFDEAVFVIEAKEGKSHNPSVHIDKIFGYKTEFQNYLKKKFCINHNNFIFVLYYSELPLDNDKYLNAHKKKIFLYSPKHKDFYLKIISKLHENAKDIIFSDLLSGHDWVDTENGNFIHVPCVKGKLGQKDFYQFLLTPEVLKKITYVHRRYLQYIINDDEFSYQRIIQPDRILEIKDFINEGGYFPNSILINFNRDIKFEQGSKPKYSLNNAEFGYLVLPKKYGYAWIIDGQHRVFGFSGLPEQSKNHQLSVIATMQMSSEKQARLYVEINQNQKTIDKDDIWDLYTQLEEQKSLNYEISKLIKNLNRHHPLFKDKIYIPSLKKPKQQFKIFIANFGNAILHNCKDIFEICTEIIIIKNNNQASKYKEINFEKVELIFNEYFKYFSQNTRIQKLLEKNKFFGTNNGTDILLRIINKFKEYLVYDYQNPKEIVENNTQLKYKIEKYTELIIKGINEITEDELMNYVKQSSSASRKENAVKILVKAARNDDKLQKICNEIYLENIKEDLYHEFKSSATYNFKGEPTPDVFEEEILGNIAGFINRGINGYIYLGIDDSGKKIGLEKELSNYKSLDEYKRSFMSSCRDNTRISELNIDQIIEISEFQSTPKIVQISVKKVTENTVCIVVNKKKKIAKVYYRIDPNKQIIKSSEFDKYFNEKQIASLNKLMATFYQEEI